MLDAGSSELDAGSTSSAETTAQLKVGTGTALAPKTLGHQKQVYAQMASRFYEVLAERIVEDRVQFAYRNLVIDNPDFAFKQAQATAAGMINARCRCSAI